MRLYKKANYQKVIVVTHRPVVEDGWRNDFDLIFGEGDNRAFLKKDRFDTDSSVYDAAMDARNDANLTAYQNSGKALFTLPPCRTCVALSGQMESLTRITLFSIWIGTS